MEGPAVTSAEERRGPEGPYSIGSTVWPGLSKLIEEAGEVQQVGGKLIGSGGRPTFWDGNNVNDKLVEELGDLLAAIEFFMEKNPINAQAVNERRFMKLEIFRKWHAERLEKERT